HAYRRGPRLDPTGRLEERSPFALRCRLRSEHRNDPNRVRRPDRVAQRPDNHRGKSGNQRPGNHVATQYVRPAQTLLGRGLIAHNRKLFDIDLSAHLAASFFSAEMSFLLLSVATKNFEATIETLPVLSRFALPWTNT